MWVTFQSKSGCLNHSLEFFFYFILYIYTKLRVSFSTIFNEKFTVFELRNFVGKIVRQSTR